MPVNPASPPRVVIGLDVGTSSVKAVAFGLGSVWRRITIREYPLLEPAPGQHVQDPATVMSAVRGALAACVGDAAGAEVIGISVGAGMHGLVALDEQGHALTPLVTWADTRAREEARSVRRSGDAAGLHASTGVPVHPMTPLTKLMWFARHEAETWAAARWWVGLKELVLLWLTGRLVTELSSASGTGLLDMQTRSWSPLALDACGVRADRLPEILPTTTALGLAPAAARDVGLPGGTPVVLGAADGPLANLGTGAMAPGLAGLSLGTSGAVRVAVGAPRVDSHGTLFCYALTDSQWVVGGAISNGASVMRWFGATLLPEMAATGSDDKDEAVLALAASVPAGSDGVVMLPYLLPERAPLWDPDLSAAYFGLRRRHTRAHLARAALEGVCLQMRLIVDALAQVEPVTSVRATGGAFRSSIWGEVMAATLGRPLVVVTDAEGTALGAAALGLLGLGRAPTLADAVAELSDPATPDPPSVKAEAEAVAVYDGLRRRLAELVAELGPVSAAFGDAGPGSIKRS